MVIGDRVVGTADAGLVRHSLRIACAAHSNLLAVRFVNQCGWRLESADSLPLLDAFGAARLVDWASAKRSMSGVAA
jgi:hypothetical protein